jgi:hypothetical protein
VEHYYTNNTCIIITAPQRFDLDYNSCINKEVRKFNKSSKGGNKYTESNSSECRDG